MKKDLLTRTGNSPEHTVITYARKKNKQKKNIYRSTYNILKSRDITLPTKVHLVKAMVFPVVMYGCKSWTVKKAEQRRIDALNCGVEEDS